MKKTLTLIAVLFSIQLNAQWHHIYHYGGSDPWYSSGIMDVTFLNDSTGTLVDYYHFGTGTSATYDYFTRISDDYGTTWNNVDFIPGGSGMATISLQNLGNSDSIIKATIGYFELSVDNGDNWTPVHTIGGWVSAYDFMNVNNAIVAIDSSPLIYRYKNGNSTMINLSSMGYNHISDVKMISSAKVFMIANDREKLIVSNDSGFTWTTALDTSTYFNHIDFIDEFTGYIACDSGQVYKTTDGGASWNLLNTGTSKHLLWSSITNDTAFFCGQQGTIIRTKDAGLTWTDQSMPWLTGSIKKIQVMDKIGYCFDGSNIYRNDNATPVIEVEKNNGLFTVYPNPAHNHITIANPQGEKIKQVQLLNALGQCEYSQNVESNGTQINIALPALTPGIKYLVVNGAQNHSYKIIIE